MSRTPRAAQREQTLGEEIANGLSHGIGFLFAIASLPVLLLFSAGRRTAIDIVAASVFSATMMLLYGVSTLYHAWPPGRMKAWLNRFDHAAIYLFIAGSYTPFVLGVLRGGWGWSLFGLVWTMAALGFTAKLANRLRHPLWSTGLYVAMGWVAVVAAAPLIVRVPGTGLAWLIAGGLSYAAGAVVFLFDSRVRYAHFVWHLFVLGGSACHFVAVLHYAQQTDLVAEIAVKTAARGHCPSSPQAWTPARTGAGFSSFSAFSETTGTAVALPHYSKRPGDATSKRQISTRTTLPI